LSLPIKARSYLIGLFFGKTPCPVVFVWERNLRKSIERAPNPRTNKSSGKVKTCPGSILRWIVWKYCDLNSKLRPEEFDKSRKTNCKNDLCLSLSTLGGQVEKKGRTIDELHQVISWRTPQSTPLKGSPELIHPNPSDFKPRNGSFIF